ncbi:MAG: EamA family transporter [Granulosicoccus sp.]|nr:EamA family transporter [Granulosicoccus sp.]
MHLSGRVRGDLFILLAAFIWGVAFYFQKIAMLQIGPLLFLGMRGTVAAAALLPFVMAEQGWCRGLAVFRDEPTAVSRHEPDLGGGRYVVAYGMFAGLVFFVAAAVQQTGIVTATVTNTGFLTALYVVVTPLLFWMVRRQRPGIRIWLAVILASTGVWGLSGGSLSALNTGDILVACSSIFWACLIIISGEASRHAQPMSYTFVQFVVVAVLGLTAALLLESIDTSRLLAAAIPILYVGVLSSALTFGLMAIALQHVPAPRASILLSMETVFAAMAGFLLLGERLSLISWVGAALILLAVYIVKGGRE